MAEALGELGYASLLFDFAGCGESEGDFADLTLSNQVADLESAFQYVRSQGFEQIITNGRSFGGATVISHAAQNPLVRGVCTWAAPAKPGALFREIKEKYAGVGPEEKVPLGEGISIKYRFFRDLEQQDLLLAASLISPRPFLIIHGEEDKVVLPENARLLWEASKEPRELIQIPGADHQFTKHYREVWEALFSWLKRYFPPSI